MTPHIRIQEERIDVGCAAAFFAQDNDAVGASAMFVGTVRGGDVTCMTLEHYPGMTERAMGEIARTASERWALLNVHLVHRIGCLLPGEVIVFIGVSAAHRTCALTACDYLIDHLKSRTPFWKKERFANTERWVEARPSDADSLHRWHEQQ